MSIVKAIKVKGMGLDDLPQEMFWLISSFCQDTNTFLSYVLTCKSIQEAYQRTRKVPPREIMLHFLREPESLRNFGRIFTGFSRLDIDSMHFKKRFMHDIANFILSLNDEKCYSMKAVAAGGCVLGAVAGTSFDDYDIFMIGKEDGFFQMLLEKLGTFLETIAPNNYHIFCVDDVLNISSIYGNIVQIVLTPYNTVEHLLMTFDLDCTRLAWDGTEIYYSNETLRALKTRKNFVPPDGLMFSNQRTSKYKDRGFPTFKARFNSSWHYEPPQKFERCIIEIAEDFHNDDNFIYQKSVCKRFYEAGLRSIDGLENFDPMFLKNPKYLSHINCCIGVNFYVGKFFGETILHKNWMRIFRVALTQHHVILCARCANWSWTNTIKSKNDLLIALEAQLPILCDKCCRECKKKLI